MPNIAMYYLQRWRARARHQTPAIVARERAHTLPRIYSSATTTAGPRDRTDYRQPASATAVTSRVRARFIVVRYNKIIIFIIIIHTFSAIRIYHISPNENDNFSEKKFFFFFSLKIAPQSVYLTRDFRFT